MAAPATGAIRTAASPELVMAPRLANAAARANEGSKINAYSPNELPKPASIDLRSPGVGNPAVRPRIRQPASMTTGNGGKANGPALLFADRDASSAIALNL